MSAVMICMVVPNAGMAFIIYSQHIFLISIILKNSTRMATGCSIFEMLFTLPNTRLEAVLSYIRIARTSCSVFIASCYVLVAKDTW